MIKKMIKGLVVWKIFNSTVVLVNEIKVWYKNYTKKAFYQ
ncbi:hypothetical protein N646_2979 [Vibrio alginolyticus NBRC 15630 = ATCC 17749]|uniref:Uncharacterized protein n=1 Tax=Vibrio alginolyticus (strain ATCC 17749 / DSM 2171 / NBRC 15630 / NCIMB 1903 / NCTC 12160 / XII-53) TaxID=1219076 RepID=A0A2I3CG86_VIBAX|nr:hypothetical protein N646_2979 [Vibrio alginolyticus NBRC 15630 = ATCC 17749]